MDYVCAMPQHSYCLLCLTFRMDNAQRELLTAEIMTFFRHNYRDRWAPDNIFDNRTREWVLVFNDLVKQGFIKRRKTPFGYEYKWQAAWPEGL
jgi:hypothetical protein